MTMTSHLGKRVLKHSFIFTTTLLTCTALQADHNDQHGDKTHQFIQKAAMGGQMEVQMGQLAEQKGQAQEVKSLGATLVRDHTQANQRLEQLASSKNITLDKSSWSDTSSTTGARSTDTTSASATARTEHTPNTAHAAKHEHKELDKLQSQSGAEFDKTFVRMAIKDHKKDISEFEHARTDVTDPEIKAFIDQTLPKLRNHLQMAQNAARVVGVNESSIAADREDDTSSNAGAPAAGAVGTRGSDKPSSPASNPDLNKQSSSYSSDRLNGASDSAVSGTVRQNNPSADLNANVGDRSISASAEADKADQSASVSTDTTTTKKHKIFSTDKNDGKFLGIIPDPHNKDRHKGASAGADVNVNGHEASVGASAGSESSSSSSSQDQK
jgi:putative membrane protein